MFSTEIYITQNTAAPRRQRRRYGYVITLDGRDYTRTGFGEVEGTYHHATLTAILEALDRFSANCQVTIHSEDAWVLKMLLNALPRWHENGYQTSKGDRIKDAELWEHLFDKQQYQKIEVVPGRHGYSSWLQSEMKRMEEGKG